MFASAKKLDNLCVIVDNNNLQIDGTIDEVNSPYPIDEKFKAFGFHVINVNGHDFDELRAAFAEAKTVKGQPTVIIMKRSRARAYPLWRITRHGTVRRPTMSSTQWQWQIWRR